jgi:hypothetical protein
VIPLPYTAEDSAAAHADEKIIMAQTWRAYHTETTWLNDYEAGYWGLLMEKALARYLGIPHTYELTGSHPCADLRARGYRYEVRGTPWIKRAIWEAGRWRTFVYPRETADAELIIARVDSFLSTRRICLTGWMWARDASRYPLDPGKHLTRHAVPGFGPLRPAATLPGVKP